MNELKLHDIKPLVDIPDLSIYFFILVICIAIIFIFAIIYLLYKKFRTRGKIKKVNYLKTLKELDLENTKESAYIITNYLRKVCKNEREIRLADELIYLLQAYKYKKEVEPFSDEIKAKYSLILEAIDV